MMKRSCTSLDQASSMAEYSGYENHPEADLFDVLTQTLFAPQANLPRVDQYLTQPPSSSAFDMEPESSTLENPQEAVESVSGVVNELQNAVGGRSSAPRFGPRVTSSEIAALQETAVPQNTKNNTSWAMNVWNDWCAYRKQQDPTDYPPWLLTMQVSELNTWLSRFVVEVRRKDGKHYPPNTLHQLFCGVLRRLREYSPAKNPEFDGFRKTLDAEMKRLKRSSEVPCAPKKAEPISAAEEEMLWENGVLGSHSPQGLVDTMVFMAGLYFALRSGDEHRHLKFRCIRLVEKPGCTPCLIYTEATSENNPGGLKNRKLQNKEVTHYANLQRPDRCFVELYKKYCLHRPPDVTGDAFYLTPLP